MSQSQAYTIGIFGGFYTPSNDFSGWRHTEPLKVKASSLEQAIELSKKQIKEKLQKEYNVDESKIETIINYVRDSNNKILCQTAWDELSPISLAFFD